MLGGQAPLSERGQDMLGLLPGHMLLILWPLPQLML